MCMSYGFILDYTKLRRVLIIHYLFNLMDQVLYWNELDSIKDLGVTFDTKLKFQHHIIEIVNNCYSVLYFVYRHVKYMSSETFVMLYKTLVRSHMEYASCVRFPYRQMVIKKI